MDEKGNIFIWDVAHRSIVKQWSADEKVLSLALFDLEANLTHANIRVPATVRYPMFVWCNRFGQQSFMLIEQGSVLSRNPITQKFLRELMLQSVTFWYDHRIRDGPSQRPWEDARLKGVFYLQ